MDATFGELETEHEKTLGDLKQAMAYGPRTLLVASHVTACTRLRLCVVSWASAFGSADPSCVADSAEAAESEERIGALMEELQDQANQTQMLTQVIPPVPSLFTLFRPQMLTKGSTGRTGMSTTPR